MNEFTLKRFLQLTVSIAILWLSVIAMSRTAQTSQQLYVITGNAANNLFSFGVASRLLAIDERSSRLVPVADLAEGSSFITTDHERRIAVIGNDPIVVIDMNSPKRPRRVSGQFGFGHFCSPN